MPTSVTGTRSGRSARRAASSSTRHSGRSHDQGRRGAGGAYPAPRRRRLKPEFGSVDLGSTNIDIYDYETKRFTSQDKAYVNSTRTLTFLLKTFQEVGVRPVIACWSVPFVRTIDAFVDMGLLPEPVFALLIHSGGGQLGAHPPTPAGGLRAYLDCLPPRNIVWSVSAKPGNLFATAAQAIQLGGHVSIGIGDHTYAELGTPTNAELVTRIVEIARACGRDVAPRTRPAASLGSTA